MSSARESFRLDVLLFSVLRERLGSDRISVVLPKPATVEMLLDRLASEHPAVEAFRPVVRVAVNQEYVDADETIDAGDEVALITPVSGG